MKQSELNHLRRLVAWVRCEIGQSPDELVETVRSIAPVVGKDIDTAAKRRLVEAHDKARNVPKYVRAALAALDRMMMGRATVTMAEDETDMCLERIRFIVSMENKTGWSNERQTDWSRGRILANIEMAMGWRNTIPPETLQIESAVEPTESFAEKVAEMQAEVDRLRNDLAAAQADARNAWDRHRMATELGNSARQELMNARALQLQAPVCQDCGDTITAHDPGVCGNCYSMKYAPPATVDPCPQCEPGGFCYRPDCGRYKQSEQTETLNLYRDAALYRWLVERLVGYDFNWMPSAPGASDGKVVAVFELDRNFRGAQDFTAALGAAIFGGSSHED